METVPNRNSPPAILARRRVKASAANAIANLSDWPQAKIDTLRRLLKDEPLLDAFGSKPHGHVAAVTLRAGARPHALGSSLSGTRTSRGADCGPCPGAGEAGHGPVAEATARDSLAETLGLGETSEDQLYAAMDCVGAAGGGGEAPGPKTPWRRCPGALRGVSGGALLPAPRPFPRRQARQASGVATARAVRWRWKSLKATPPTPGPWGLRWTSCGGAV